MNCQVCQTDLLMAADARWPAPEAAEHLAGCPACQEWQRQLLRIENNVARVPVPPSAARQAFVQRLIQGETLPATLPLPRRWRMPAYATAGLVAAGLLVACGIFLGNHLAESLHRGGPGPQAQAPEETTPRKSPGSTSRKTPAGPSLVEKEGPANPPATPLLARLLACDLSLADATTMPQRLEALASLADELQGETRTLAQGAGTDDLKTLARLYEKVVQQGIVARAANVPADQRRAVLGPLISRLSKTHRELGDLADRSGPGPAAPLLQIAAAANTGSQRLRKLMQEETP